MKDIDFLKHAAEGQLERKLQHVGPDLTVPPTPQSVFRKYVVQDVLLDLTEIQEHPDEYRSKYLQMNISNSEKVFSAPRNSIIAQPLEIDGGGVNMVLYPFFPSHLSMPAKPGELVWVVFDKPNAKDVDVGYWICRVPDVSWVDDPNHTHFPRRWDPSLLPPGSRAKSTEGAQPQFEFRNGAVRDTPDGRVTVPETRVIYGPEDAFETLLKESDGRQASTPEAVPRFNKRPDDVAFEGSNNTLIVLGTDRSGPAEKFETDPDTGLRRASLPETDLTHHAGSIDIVAGRGQGQTTAVKEATNSLGQKESDKSLSNQNPREGDPDLKTDRSRVLVTVGTGKFIDGQLNEALPGVYTTVMSGDEITRATDAIPGAVAIKSDVIRMVARAEIIIVSTNYDVEDGKMIEKVDSGEFACVVLKPNGDIILKPATKGLLKLGDETADRALLCTDLPAIHKDGAVSPATPPLSNTMGGKFGGTQIPTQGTWAKKILVVGAK